MRNLIVSFCVVSFIFIVLSCNNSTNSEKNAKDSVSNKKNNPDDIKATKVDCSTIGNFLIPPDEADEMIKHFTKKFRQIGLEEPFWVDSCTILSLERFFSKFNEYDGVRIHLGDNTAVTEIIIAPTKPVGTSDTHHTDEWDNIPLSAGCRSDFVNLNPNTRERRLNRFYKNYRRETSGGGVHTAKNDSLSRAVWFSKCVIDSLSKYLKDPSYGLDGIRIHHAAYKDFIGNPGQTGQRKANQSTFVIVVTKPDGFGVHKDDWTILAKIFATDPKFLNGGYNHGQLCPNLCD